MIRTGIKNEPIPFSSSSVRRMHGKPFDYFRLGKSFQEGRQFMEYMRETAKQLLGEAERKKAIVSLNACPVCSSQQHHPIASIYGFAYHQCGRQDCGHVFVQTQIEEKYRNDFFSKNSQYHVKNYCDKKLSEIRINEIAAPKVAFGLNHLSAGEGSKSWLDVGCGSGETLVALGRKGWRGIGLELNPESVDFAKSEYQVDVRRQTLDEFISGNQALRFDIISFFGVLHCLPNPGAILKSALSILRPGGIIVAELTHHNSLEFSAVNSFSDQPSRSCYNGATTLHHFTFDSSCRLFLDCGLIPQTVWFYGTDFFEILNQWCFASPQFFDSPLYKKLLGLSGDIQASIDQSELSSGMMWAARNEPLKEAS